MAGEKSRLQLLKEIKAKEQEIAKFALDNDLRFKKNKVEALKLEADSIALKKESAKILEDNLKTFAATEKSIGQISNSYRDFKNQQKETNDLVLGTHGRGIIIIDDISPLRELNEATQKKTLHFFESKPTVIKETQNFSGNFGNETQFVGANKSSQAQIKYHLKKRHTFGKMTMAIVNSEGDTLSELTPGKSKGINIVNWSFRKKQPKVAKGKTFSFGGFTTPVLPAGKYMAKITKGKQTFEHPFELVYDAKSTVSSKDRVFKHKTVNEIYEMIETLAYKVYILDAYLDYATSSQKKKLIKKLNALKETMVITTGDNYVGAAEPQLREKMTAIFQRIEQNYGAPTPDEIQNLATIKNRFNSAVESLEKIIKKYKLKRMVPVKSLEEYLKS